MKLRIPPSLSLLLLLPLGAGAQTADDFFHGGAQRYLTNNIPGALEAVTNGLQRFPDDEKLKKLYALLNQQQQQQQQQDQKQQQEDKQDQQQQDQQKQDEKQDQQSKNDQQKKEEQRDQAKDKKEQQKKDQPQSKPGENSKEQPEAQAQQATAHAMTPQEAKQLLDAQKDDEQVLIFQPQGKPKDRSKLLKDW